jgi:hypothetical protein
LYGGYWQGSQVKGTMPNILNTIDNNTSNTSSVYDYENPYNYDEKYNFDSRKDNRFEAGWVAGIGISYNLNKRYQVFTEGRLLYSFTDQQKDYQAVQVPRYNSTYGINVGVLYSFGHLNPTY